MGLTPREELRPVERSIPIKPGDKIRLCDTVTNSSYGLTGWMSWFLRGLLYPLISVLSCFNEDPVLVKVEVGLEK